MVLRFILAILFTTTTTAVAQNPNLIAGIGKGGFSGDGLPAVVAQLKVPSDVFVTPDGSVYIADTGNDRIRRIDPEGKIQTIAGNGQRIFSNDGGLATESGLMAPSAVAVDGRGNVYFSEWTGHRVRKIGTDGRLTTLAGNGESGYVGENLTATETSLWSPSKIFLDGKGNLYIAEWGANRIRVVNSEARISTVAGNGDKGFSGDGGPATDASMDRPNGLFVTTDGEIYLSDLGSNRVRKVDSDGIIQTVAGDGEAKFLGDGGPATEASLDTPAGLFIDRAGSLYICDGRNKKVRKVDAEGVIHTWIHGLITSSVEGKPRRQPLRNPTGVFIDPVGHIYVSDGTMNTILRIPDDAAGTTLNVVQPGTVGFAIDTGWWESFINLF
ncbi:MAG: hypothetical protein CME19_14330 [Gemmatimonadetes bacterium]|nr:hypothetical protein [Gemmatimonadota bacterium]|tara:strand:+ start:1749 stop:2900 length:1152 start_codon:yes stop_codon:yes gene_type:complete